MTNSGKIVPLELVEPEAARRLLPGVHFFVSAKTFAEAAEAVDKDIEAKLVELRNRETYKRQASTPRVAEEPFPGAEV